MQILTKTNLEGYKKAKKIGPLKTINLLNKKGLTGRSGSRYPTGTKWLTAIKTKAKIKYLICNADEGEPGTFKDKFILVNNPELVIEGILIAANCIGAKQAFIYLREEYDYLKNNLEQTIKKLIKKTKAKTKINIILGAGGYICGEETAILESIEGRRGQAQIKPPYPTTEGLYGQPTVINNVETLANVPLAILKDNWNKDYRLFSISGNVKKPGVYETKLGTCLLEVVQQAQPKVKPKAIYIGCSCGCLKFEKLKMNQECVCKKGCSLGACTTIVVGQNKPIPEVALNIAQFYEFESCGRCTPCREGTVRIVQLLQKFVNKTATKKDLVVMKELASVIKDTSFCALGQTSMNHLITALKHFPEEFKCK